MRECVYKILADSIICSSMSPPSMIKKTPLDCQDNFAALQSHSFGKFMHLINSVCRLIPNKCKYQQNLMLKNEKNVWKTKKISHLNNLYTKLK